MILGGSCSDTNRPISNGLELSSLKPTQLTSLEHFHGWSAVFNLTVQHLMLILKRISNGLGTISTASSPQPSPQPLIRLDSGNGVWLVHSEVRSNSMVATRY